MKMRAFDDMDAARQGLFDGVLNAVQTKYPVENQSFRLEIANPAYKEKPFSLKDQKNALLQGRSLTRPLHGTWRLVDKTTNKTVDQKRGIVAHVPYLTNRGTFIYNGNEYTVANQMRLRPGVFTRVKDNGELEAHVNVAPGTGKVFRVFMEPKTGIFRMKVGQANLKLYPILQSIGLTDKQISKAWGPSLLGANKQVANNKAVSDAYDRFASVREQAAVGQEAKAKSLLEAFIQMKLDPDVTERTLGARYNNVTPEVLLRTTTKLLNINRGTEETDDRDSLAFQRFHSVEDQFPERILKDAGQLGRKHLWSATLRRGVQHIPSGALTPQMRAVLLNSGLGQPIEEINPLDVYDQNIRVLRLGEGGIPTIRAVPEDARNVQPTYFGYIDPIRGPESERIGVDLRMTYGTFKGQDGHVYTAFKNVKTGKNEMLKATEAAEQVIAFPGEMESRGKHVRALVGGKGIQYVPRKRVTYELPSPQEMFSMGSNLTPLPASTAGGRLFMVGKMINQALPLRDPEAPLVRNITPDGKSFEEYYGGKAGAVFSDEPGMVTRVGKDNITVRTRKGMKRYELYHNFPFNRKTFLHNTPTVRAGDRVVPGQVIARSNFTDEQGRLAAGKNLSVAYMPYQGSIAANTHVLWYDDGMPKFTEVRSVRAKDDLAALATDPQSLTTGVSKAAGFTAHSAASLLRITTSSGRELDATKEHSFVVLSSKGELVEVEGRNLAVGNWIPRVGRVDLPVVLNSITIPPSERKKSAGSLAVELTEDFGFVCGLYAAEGYVSRNKVVTFAAVDKKTRESIAFALRKTFPTASVKMKKNDVRLFDSSVAQWFKKEGGHLAQSKKVPDFVFGSPTVFRKAFIAGFWVGDGRTHDKQGTPCDTDTLITSRRLRDGLGLLMASVGISTTHSNYDDLKCSEGKSFRLGVSMRDAHKLPDIKPYHTNKGQRLDAVTASYKGCGSADHVPLFDSVRSVYKKSAKGSSRRTYSRVERQVRQGLTASRKDILSLVPEATKSEPLRRLRALASSDLEWDRVTSIVEVPCTDWVYDFDMYPLRTFVCVDTLVVHNSNFEDAIVISESAARKLSSEHMYSSSIDVDKDTDVSKKTFLSLYPGAYNKDQVAAMGDNGVVRPGTVVKRGDPLLLAVRWKTLTHGPHRKQQRVNASVDWDHHADGVVTDVTRSKTGWNVHVKAYAPTQVGDKLSGRFAGKGVVSQIVPDDQMVQDANGNPVDVILNPMGVVSRCYDEQTEFLTERGWVFGRDVVEDDKFVCYRTWNNSLYVLDQLESFHSAEYSGKMLRFENKLMDFCVTPNHRMWARSSYPDAPWQEVTASRIAGHIWRVPVAGKPVTGNDEDFHLPETDYHVKDNTSQRGEIIIEAGDWAEFLGWYLSEGNCDEKTHISQSVEAYPENHAQISALLDRLPFKWFYNSDNIQFHVTSKRLTEYLKQFGKCDGKYIPDWLFRQSFGTRLRFLEAFWAGDGCETMLEDGRHSLSACSCSERLIDDLQRLLVYQGSSAGKQSVKVDKRYKPMWRVGKHFKTERTLEAHNWSEVDYDGMIYCPTVPTGYVVTRRNGKVVIAGNTNPGQIIETVLGKIAKKTGRAYDLSPFPAHSILDFARSELRRAGMSDTEEVFDPVLNKKIPGILVGSRFLMKLHHTAESKESGRSLARYTSEDQPARGGKEGSKRLSAQDISALIAHGALDVLRDSRLVRGQRNDDYWRAYRLGFQPKDPEVPLVYKKFLDSLRAGGVNVQKRGNQMNVMALTNKDVDELAGTREVDLPVTVDPSSLKPIPGGLFDLGKTGGHGGKQWSFIKLTEPLPNPVMEEPVRRILGLTPQDYEAILSGRKELNGKTGGDALRDALSRIKIDPEIARQREIIGTRRGQARDNAVKVLGYLQSAKKHGLHPKDFILDKVPVIPPIFRPISTMKDTAMVADANILYKDLLNANSDLAELRKAVGTFESADERQLLYSAFKAVTGLGDPISPKATEKKVKGLLAQAIGGGAPKYTMFQRRVLGSPVDVVGRGTITPNPSLDMDQVGLPESMAWTIYRPFTMRRLVRQGMSPKVAAEAVEGKDDRARKAMLDEMNSRPVIVNRAPVLHKFGMMAFEPILVKGSTLQVSPLVVGPYNADFDGDAMNYHVPVSKRAVTEAKEKMLPSKNLFSASGFEPHYVPSREYLYGLALATGKPSRKKTRTFTSHKAVVDAFKRGEIGINDPVIVL